MIVCTSSEHLSADSVPSPPAASTTPVQGSAVQQFIPSTSAALPPQPFFTPEHRSVTIWWAPAALGYTRSMQSSLKKITPPRHAAAPVNTPSEPLAAA